MYGILWVERTAPQKEIFMARTITFEARMKHIEELCERMNGDVDIDEVMKLYEEVVKGISQCKKQLDSYSSRLEELSDSCGLNDISCDATEDSGAEE